MAARERTTRRRWLQGSLVSAATAACAGMTRLCADMFTTAGAEGLPATPVVVPEDFVGMHAHRWPVGEPRSPAPTYAFGAARSHDFEGTAWRDIHIAAGRYVWTALDAWVRVHAAAQRTLIYTLYGTPAWLASSTARSDAYGAPGGAAPPRDLRFLAEFIQALLKRYNGDGQRRIHFVETWNEPNFAGRTEDFWWGTAAELVALGEVLYRTAKQTDAGIRVLSPGFAGNLAGSLTLRSPRLADAQSSSLYQYLTSAGESGHTGAACCDAIAFHCYNAPLDGVNRCFQLEIVRMQRMLALMGVRLPLYDTEFGFLPGDAFHRLSKREQANTLRRCAAVQAFLGVQGILFYAHDDDLVGGPAVHPEVAEAIGDLHAMMAGKTLQQVTLLPDGRVRVTTPERTLVW